MEQFTLFLRRNYSVFLTLFILNGLMISQLYSQTFCLTPPTSNYSGFNQSILNMDEEGPFYLRIYVHVIRQSDGTGGQSVSDVYEALSYLDQDYNSHNIFFVWDCVIDYIDNDGYYNSQGTSAIFNVNSHTDGIDIYLFRDNPPPGATGNGLAQGIGATAFYVFGNFWNPPYNPLVRSHIISHEMGHCINLWHPWQGPNNCQAFVNGSNCHICGDLVCDTPAEPPGGLSFNVDPQSCTWTLSGNDPNGDAYNPDESLIMGYTLPDCMEYFSKGQGQRMRNSIAELPILQNCLVQDASHIITGTVNWNSSVEVFGNIEVEDGGSLTITDVVSFLPSSKFIIKPGGKVTIDGGILTNINDACHGNSMWHGVEVWGNANASQYWASGQSCPQGRIDIVNGGTIENAIIAVDLWKPGDWSSTGGIIYADSAIFRNNAKSVHALHYRNFNPYFPEIEWDYFSNFKNCTFEITEDYLGDETFYKHVDLAYVNGIDFQGCDFSLAENVAGVSTSNHAIAAYDARFRVTTICNSQQAPCPEVDYDRSTFTGFWSAVSAVNDGGVPLTFSVNRADFFNNAFGVRTTYMNNASVLFSNFEVGNYSGCGTGIYTDYVTGFAFEENDFSKYTGSPVSDYFGIIINSSEAVNEVYKNTYNGLSYANFSDGRNHLLYNYWEGLAYYCNENDNNYADFFVNDFTLGNPSGIQTIQGSETYVSGNTFTQSGATWHYYNGGGAAVVYYCNEYQVPTLIKGVIVMPRSETNSCPSHYGGNSELKLVMNAQQKADAEQDYYNNLTDYNSVKTLYDSYVDGGDTEAEKLAIQTAQPDDMWELRAQLLGDSPHLSLEVLKEAADKTDVFTESALFDILAANPDELKKDTLISYLENKEDPLPDYMIDLLRQLAQGTTYKTALQQQMAGYIHAYTRATHDIIRSNLNDTVTDNVELRNWLDNIGGITSDRQIISSYISEGNFTDAITLANMLPQLYDLDNNELTEHTYYMDMLYLHQTLYQESRNTFQLDSTEKASIVFIANNSTGVAGAQAKSILEGVYNEYFDDCPDADGTTGYKSNSIINPDALGKAYGLNISVKPNPAKQWAAFDYTLPGDETEAIITISNSIGNIVEMIQISGSQGQNLWDTRTVKPGVYIYTIKAAGYSQSGKIVISK